MKISPKQNNIQNAIEAFLLDRKIQNLTEGSIAFYRKRLAVLAKFCSERKIAGVTELEPNNIRQFFVKLGEDGHNPGGLHSFYRVTKTFLFWFENEYEPDGWRNPIRKVKAPFVPLEPLEPVSNEDFQKLLATCKDDWTGKRDQAIILTLIETGVRASELCSINLEDFDQSDGSILIRSGKGRKSRYVFTGKRVQSAVVSWLAVRDEAPGTLFLKTNRQPMRYSTLRQMLRRRAEQAGIQMPSPHDFRRAFVLGQLQAGVPETTIARIAGHSTTSLIARYANQSKADLKSSFKSLMDDKE